MTGKGSTRPSAKPLEGYTDKFEDVAKEEKRIVRAQRQRRGVRQDGRIGLALSGGGIRSASFGLGVLQALERHSLFRLIDYLSTVSGGGYIGSSLSWFLRKGREDFPLGTKGLGARSGPKRTAGQASPNEILTFMRQHGNYLTPDRRSTYSLGALVFRNAFISLVVYTAALAVAFALVKWIAANVMERVDAWWPELASVWGLFWDWDPIPVAWLLLMLAASLIALFIVVSIVLQIGAYGRLIVGKANIEKPTLFRKCSYRFRWARHKASGVFWFAVAMLLIGGSVPVAYRLLSPSEPGPEESIVTKAALVAVVSTLIGVVGSVRDLFTKLRKFGGDEKTPSGLRKVAGAVQPGILAFLAIYGLLLLSYWIGSFFQNSLSPWWLLGVAVGAVVLAGTTSLNFVGVNRMYRDRLMELFLADDDVIRRNAWADRADGADATYLWDVAASGTNGPYHILNANIVTTDDKDSKYRGRGGDSFVLSPLYCGSNATGWRRTGPIRGEDDIKDSDTWWMRGGLTLPTAMAISGAAVNPNTGVGGRGPTRSRPVSMVMALLNLRLGYWAYNPTREPCAARARATLLYPGLWQGLFGRGLKSTKPYIHLTDGGHFENLGVYELVRRRLDTIFVSDASADPKHSFASLANAVERVRVDFGVSIHFDQRPLGELLPKSAAKGPETDKYDLAKRGYAVATIKYPEFGGEPAKEGQLIYIKPVLTPKLTADVLGYNDANEDFPHEWTADQFFNEEQFEAYRELGYRLTDHMCDDLTSKRLTIEALVVQFTS